MDQLIRLGPEIFHFGNRQGKVIVVFDNDERVACIAARELVEKGYDNTRMLSQGLAGIGNAHPE
jgi:centrosomal protein CEP41